MKRQKLRIRCEEEASALHGLEAEDCEQHRIQELSFEISKIKRDMEKIKAGYRVTHTAADLSEVGNFPTPPGRTTPPEVARVFRDCVSFLCSVGVFGCCLQGGEEETIKPTPSAGQSKPAALLDPPTACGEIDDEGHGSSDRRRERVAGKTQTSVKPCPPSNGAKKVLSRNACPALYMCL